MNVADGVFPTYVPGVGGCAGLTKRELVASLALQALIAGHQFDAREPLANLAVRHADALLAALAKPPAA
ncbi:MAG: hypothetical protein E6Q97_33575 [Desulfurellales bacterium]|nr:MAG: hypothetical protein E6Q97_33575 [Desulfurellales bacterium]